MALSCQQFWNNLKLIASNDDEPSDELFDAVDDHLATCIPCQQALAATTGAHP